MSNIMYHLQKLMIMGYEVKFIPKNNGVYSVIAKKEHVEIEGTDELSPSNALMNMLEVMEGKGIKII